MAASERFNAESAHIFARPHWMLAPWRRELTRRKHQVFPIVKAAIDASRHSADPNDGLMNHYVNGNFITSNDNEMLTILVGLLMGAQDNVASALGWVLAYLAFHPDLQDQLGGEIRATGTTAGALRNCGLLVSTVKEILRLRPPAPANQPRRFLRPVEIAGHRLPKGTYIFNSFYNMHRNASVFDAPETFDPTRFQDERLAGVPDFAPFGHGPRNCVAQGMALQQLLASVTGLLHGHWLVPRSQSFPSMTQTPFLLPTSFDVSIERV